MIKNEALKSLFKQTFNLIILSQRRYKHELLITSLEFPVCSLAYPNNIKELLYYVSFHVIDLISFIQLSLSPDQLEENLSVLLKDVENQKPQRKSGNLITLVCMFNINLNNQG